MVNYFYPVLDSVNAFLTLLLPAWLVLILWGAISGMLVMGVYALSSPQKKIKKKKEEIKDIQKRLKEAGDDFKASMALSLRNLAMAFELLGLVLLPALLASVPAIILLAWTSTTYNYAPLPPGSTVVVEMIPAGQGITVEPPERLVGLEGGKILLTAQQNGPVDFIENGKVIYRTGAGPLPAGTVGKRTWWSHFWESENGYIDQGAAIDGMIFERPRRQLLHRVPGWMSTWEFAYFLTLCIVALSVKFAFRIH